MTDTLLLKIAFSSYLHDIGKFAERAEMEIPEDYQQKYGYLQPYYKGFLSHKHALYTAAFFDKFKDCLPDEFNRAKWGEGDSFFNLSAGHHNPDPDKPLQWIVAIADRISSGFDRSEFEDKSKEISIKEYIKTRLLPIFEGISLEEKEIKKSIEEYSHRYPLKELSPLNIFPVKYSDIDKESSKNEYSELFKSFCEALKQLKHINKIELWFEHFDSLFMIYASHIPAATVGSVVPDVSLYDHCKTTSAIASALYKYHQETNSLGDINAIKDYEVEKFLIITGDFYGIQDFIFTEGGLTQKAAAKLLRGRSFYISILTELAAHMVCKQLELTFLSVVLNAAGKFTILAQNTENAKKTVKELDGEINDWLIKHFYGQASMGLSFTEASCSDFVKGRFMELWEKVSKKSDERKFKKINLLKYGGSVKDYLDSFDRESGVCPFCNRRPAEKGVNIKQDNSCSICRDHIFIGENLVKKNQLVITEGETDYNKANRLYEPIYGSYQLSFAEKSEDLNLKLDKVVKWWDISIIGLESIEKTVTSKFINGYVPKYDDSDESNDSEVKKNTPKTFADIALEALNFDNKGVDALGILKADVDNLGLLFSCGFRKEMFTISRIATFSRQLNNFFCLFIPYKLSTEEKFKNIYTVFAGGDDLFLIGPWNRIIDFASFLNTTFKKYVCYNRYITISAGIAIHKDCTPVLTFAKTAEDALLASKANKRDSITIFGTTTKWSSFVDLEDIKKIIQNWLEREKINSSMIFRFNEFIEMRRQEEEVRARAYISIEDLECLKWRSMFKYTVVRNIGKDLKAEERAKLLEEVMGASEWFEKYGLALRIPLWQIIYKNRKRRQTK